MASQKFSNFSIDFILGDGSKQTSDSPEVDHPASFRDFSGHLSRMDLLYQERCRNHSMRINVPSPSWAGLYNCCLAFPYYQPTHYGGQPWPGSGWETESQQLQHTAAHRQRSRFRTVFTDHQTEQLEKLFSITDYPTADTRAELARNTCLSEETVRVWFKNRRARRKRQNTCPERSSRPALEEHQESD
ncbi:hypothetical protein DNTS_011608 [Danionella cerebrum]|uniref:Homeobox domain-containing protein n=1 Tax=Danionella cerebrum TaxID=2873325 RepID=A0A553QT75_9TELE|nr:hypothetical protein DNTS_011608 [Danionella translucida]